MPSFTITQSIDATPEKTFQALIDPQFPIQCIAGVSEATPLDDGPMGVGSRLRQTRTLKGRTETVDAELTEYDPPRLISTTAEAQGLEITYRYTLEPENEGTLLSCEVIIEATNFMAKMLLGTVFEAIRQADDSHLARGKAFLEGKA